MVRPDANRSAVRLAVPVRGVSLQAIERGAGAPTLFQHGLGATAGQVDDVMAAVDGLRVLTVECRGHGGSPLGPERPFSMALMANDVMAVAAARGFSWFLAGGISMGAAIALRLAVHHPGRVRALILLRPAWLWDDVAPPALAGLRTIASCLRDLAPAQAREAFLASEPAHALKSSSPDSLGKLLHWFDRPDPNGVAALLGGLAGGGSGVSRQEAGALALPTLVVAQAQDALHPVSIAEALSATIPGAQLAIVPAPGKSGKVNRAAIAAAVSRFLGDHPGLMEAGSGQ